MARAYLDLIFTPTVRRIQTTMGSREQYSPFDGEVENPDRLTPRETKFIGARDSFYQASVSESGWPYVQFRGGRAGFLKVLDDRTLAYADFRGNVQYVSIGNFTHDQRIAMILMDYANQKRLKLLGRVRLVAADDDPDLIARLRMPGYPATIERAVVIDIAGYDWNCPQHITPRFTEQEVEQVTAPLRAQLRSAQAKGTQLGAPGAGGALGSGTLPLIITAIGQLTPRVRSYELRSPTGLVLPAVTAGSHLEVPVRTSDGQESTRRYSIASHPRTRNSYEIAVLRVDEGGGGSAWIHTNYSLGLTLNCGHPENHFTMHDDSRKAILIAGGIGITPIRAMALQLASDGRAFELHFAARSPTEAAYAESLQVQLGGQIHTYFDPDRLLPVRSILAGSADGSVFYVCGPGPLIEAARQHASELGISVERLRYERFAGAASKMPSKAVRIVLQRSRKEIDVPAGQTILDAVEALGISAPYSCRTGTCGTCAVKVLDGTPDHRDEFLSESDRNVAGLMCICVSRSLSAELTLDL